MDEDMIYLEKDIYILLLLGEVFSMCQLDPVG